MSGTIRKQVDNASYRTTIEIGASRFSQIAWYFVNIIFFKNPFNTLSSLKVALLRSFGAKLGKGVVIKPAVNIKFPWKLQIGDHSWIGEEVWIDTRAIVSGGVSCRSHSILGMNSVAEKDLETYTVYKGNPAVPVIIRTIF